MKALSRDTRAKWLAAAPNSPVSCVVAALGTLLAAPPANAFPITTDVPELTMEWSNTIRYGLAERVKSASPALFNSPPLSVNQDDGDRAFHRGVISNRVDLFSEFDLRYSNFGARVSGAAWYDQVYNRTNDNTSAASFNAVSVPSNEFTKTARDLHGRKAEFLDTFVFGKGTLGDLPVSFRAGRFALLWGESLFFGSNGIAGTQSAVDIIKLSSVPNAVFRETIRPDAQISGQVQFNAGLSAGAYYKFSWQKNRLPAVGSYFASTDIINGGERLLTGGAFPTGAPRAFFRGEDIEAKNSGQGGVQLKWRPAADWDLGFYALKYHDRNPSIYQYGGVGVSPVTGQIGLYKLVYAENVKAFGTSLNTSFGSLSFSAEASVRRDAPLASDGQAVAPTVTADNNANPLYAVGNTGHLQASFIWTMDPNAFAREASLVGEVAFNRRLSVSKNPNALAAFGERDALGLRLIYTPTFRQVLPGLDISVPIGGSYFPKGKSTAVSNFGVDKGGDYAVGVAGAYLDVWRFSLNYTGFYGPENTFLILNKPGGTPTASFGQSLKDRNFVALSLSRTF
jgi:Protein of unknown function (DUF1302)